MLLDQTRGRKSRQQCEIASNTALLGSWCCGVPVCNSQGQGFLNQTT